MKMSVAPKNVLLIGGTRFSGLYLWKELVDRVLQPRKKRYSFYNNMCMLCTQGHKVTLFNRGKTSLKKLPKESEAQFEARKAATAFIQGNRQNADELKEKLADKKFDVRFFAESRYHTQCILTYSI